MTTATIDNAKATKTAKAPKVEVAPVAAPVEVTVKEIEKTGLMSGLGEMRKYHSTKDGIFYSVSPSDPFRLTEDQWVAMKAAFIPVANIEAQKQAAVEQALKPDIPHIVGFTLAIKDEIQPCTDVTYDTLLKMLEKHNVKLEDMTFTIAPQKGGKKGKKTSGEGSGFFKAESPDQLKRLNPKERLVVEYAIKHGGEVPLDRWADFGYNERQSFVNAAIGFKQKGFAEGVTAAGGTFRFYLDRLNFSLQDALDAKKS